MNKCGLYLCIFCLFIGCYSVSALGMTGAVTSLSNQEQDSIRAICTDYSLALKDGNIDGIRRHISGIMYDKSKSLLEDNQQYGNFLRNHYQGAEFRTGEMEAVGDEVIVPLIMVLPTGNESVSNLILRKDSFDTWKIIGEE